MRTRGLRGCRKGGDLVRKNQGKVNDLVKDMLSYSKDREPDVEPTDLNAIVREVVELMQPNAKDRGISVTTKLEESLPQVPADREAIHRSVLNIVSNAFDAVEGSPTPKVLIGTSRELFGGALKEPFVRVQVRDNGSGIAPEKLEEIFKPFV